MYIAEMIIRAVVLVTTLDVACVGEYVSVVISSYALLVFSPGL